MTHDDFERLNSIPNTLISSHIHHLVSLKLWYSNMVSMMFYYVNILHFYVLCNLMWCFICMLLWIKKQASRVRARGELDGLLKCVLIGWQRYHGAELTGLLIGFVWENVC